MIEEIDWPIGEVLKALKENGLEKKTIVALTSDNGADSKPDRNGNEEKGSNLPLKGWKGSSEEGGVRVPFVVTAVTALPGGRNWIRYGKHRAPISKIHSRSPTRV